MSILMPNHININVHMKRVLQANDISGIRLSKNVRLSEIQTGELDK